jgi:PPIC-type PPIASE domain
VQRTSLIFCVFAITFFALIGCKSSWPKPNLAFAKKSETEIPKAPSKSEPDYITVQHCLVGFNGSIPGKSISRSKEEARALATQLLAEAKAGADFDEMVRKNTNDSPPGIYKMTNYGKMAIGKGTFERDGMVPAFGNTGFPLQVGEFGLAEYHTSDSPFGWHIIKRIE